MLSLIRDKNLKGSSGPRLGQMRAADGSPRARARDSPGTSPRAECKATSFWEKQNSGNRLSVEMSETMPFKPNDAVLPGIKKRGGAVSERFKKESVHNRCV